MRERRQGKGKGRDQGEDELDWERKSMLYPSIKTDDSFLGSTFILRNAPSCFGMFFEIKEG